MPKTREIILDDEQNSENHQENDEQLIQEELIKTIKEKNLQKVRDFAEKYPDATIAKLLNVMLIEEQLTFLRLLKTSDAAEIFSYLDEEVQTKLAQCFTEEWGMKLLQELQSDELVDVLEELPANVTSKILAFTPNEKRIEINRLLRYHDNQVGSFMSIDLSSIKNTYTCEQALNKIRRDYNKARAELMHFYFVIDGSNKLLGALTLEDIAFADPNALINDIYYSIASVSTYDNREYAAQVFSEHDLSVLPVVNREGYLVGMITSDDVIDVIQDSASEDMYKLAGMNPKEIIETTYLKTSIGKIIKSRIFWLIALLMFATLTQIVIDSLLRVFSKNSLNSTLTKDVILIISLSSLIPILNNITSNSGFQSNISITRAITLREINKKDFNKIILKEMLISLIIGLILGIINFARLGIYYSANKQLLGTEMKKYLIIICVSSITILISIILSNFIGIILPIIASKIKKDPSSISISLINTLTDIITTLITLSLMILSFFIFV